MNFGLNQDSLDSLIQNLHSYQRKYVLRQVGDGRQPVIYNQAGYMHPTEGQPDMSEAGLKKEVDIAAAIGAELFMVDAGWYSNLGQKWYLTTGDWRSGNCLPNDLFPVFDYAREKGLKCGLWVEIESAGRESVLAREHPDWFIERYGHSVERVLDLAKPEVQNYVESEIIRLIERYRLDMFRLDYNLFAREGGYNLRHGQNENTLWRHQEAIYGIFDRIGRRYPELQLENCASGGGRTDLGMVSRFTTTWISDWMKLPRTVRIFNGLSMALPPEFLNRCFGVCMDGAWRGNTETQIQTAIMGHPTFLGIAPTLSETNPALMVLIGKYIRIYKSFIRPFHREALVYHHTPVIQGADGTGWCAWEYVSPDQKKAVAVVFRLLQAPGDEYRLCFRGLAGDRTYQVTQEPGGITMVSVGAELLQRGIAVRLESALTSQMFLLQAVE